MATPLKIFLYKANVTIRLFLLALLQAAPATVFSQNNSAESYINAAYGQYLNFQLESCSRTLASAPVDPMIRYQQVLLNSTEIFISDDRDLYKDRKSMESEQLDNLMFTAEYNNFLKSEIKLQWAVLKLKNGDEFSAFWGLRQAYNIAKENVEEYPDFLPSHKTLGLLHVLYGVFPDKYDWILSLFGIEGDVDLGISELTKVHGSNHFLSLEAGISIGMLYAYLLNDAQKGVDAMESIHAQSERLLIDYAYSLILMKNAQSDVALNVLEESKNQYPKPFAIPQVYYLLGEINLQKGQLKEAIAQYQQFLAHQSGMNMVKDANYKIGICYLIKGNKVEASSFFNKAKDVDYAKNEADKNAASEVESGHYSYKKLYQMRYATDGGYYELAQQTLLDIDVDSLQDRDICEYHYRSARLYHKTEKIDNAIESYLKTMALQEDQSWYYAPNSALQLGLIYKSRLEYDRAEEYLRAINKYKDYPYQTSIRQKAKAALKEIP